VTVTIADPKANPFDPTASHKTLNYWNRLQTLVRAAHAQAAEALWFTVSNHLCGGAVSNAVIIKDGKLLTPIARGEEEPDALPAPVLPGITRGALLEIAEDVGLPIEKRMLSIEDVLGADELMLTNSSWLVLPVVHVEKHTIADGKVGELTLALYDGLMKRIADECVGTEADGPGDEVE
jgi:branched-subunit amino acid aminotransferase/4-amino-4-deoxychorismate lyase